MKQILGEQSQFIAIDFRKPQAPRCLHRSLKRPSPNWIVKTALFSDGFAGRHAVSRSFNAGDAKPGCEVITGTNLQLLLEMVLEREGLSGEEFRVQALECGHRGLTSLVDELGRCHEECPVEEGI